MIKFSSRVSWAVGCPIPSSSSSLLLVVLLVITGATGLKNLKMTAPERVRVGDSALMTCSYDLENSVLYTIKWYLDEKEFYRYVPKKEPPYSTFNVRGIQVNVSNSNMQDVTLDNVQRNHTGRYKCEVSEDEPHYDTQIQEADVLVVDVPATDPKITVDKQRLTAGEMLKATCESGASSTAPNITWTVNGVPLNNITMRFRLRTFVNDYENKKHQNQHQHQHQQQQQLQLQHQGKKLTKSILSLNTTGLFQDNRIRLRCFAEIALVYKASAVIEITEDGPYISPITGDASPHSHYTNGSCRMVLLSIWSQSSAVLALSLILGLLLGNASTR